jgi:hypothetical protein
MLVALTLVTPHVGPLEVAGPARQVLDLLHRAGCVPGRNDSRRQVFSDDAARPDQGAFPYFNTRKEGHVRTNARLPTDSRSPDAITIAGAHRMRIVGEDDVRAEEHVVLHKAAREKATGVHAHAVPNLVPNSSTALVPIETSSPMTFSSRIIAPWPMLSRAPIWTPA